MGKKLKDNISSDYIRASNKLGSKHARAKIVAYVESYDDIFFWRTVLSSFENEQRYFEVMLPSRQRLTKGKKSVLMNLLSKTVGENMIACVDADYDYLLRDATPTSREVNHNPYVFHTYAYAIENLQCYASGLHEVVVAVTLNDKSIFDFEDFLRSYSEAVFPLFVWSIWFYRKGIYGKFTITDFNRIIATGHFSLEDFDASIQKVRKKVWRKIRQFHKDYPDAKESYLALKEDIKRLGVTPQTTYLYIQGHHLFDNIVVPVLKKVCDKLVYDREQEIIKNAVHALQRKNELASYEHSMEGIVSMLRRGFYYQDAPPFQRLKNDLAEFLSSESYSSPTEANVS